MSALVIIGLMSGAVLMTLPSPKPAALTQGEALTRDLNRAAQSSLIGGEAYGFGLSNAGYAIYAYRDEVWDIVNSADWAEALTPALTLEGRTVKLTETLAPAIIFEPTGLTAPFTISLQSDAARFHVLSAGSGPVILEPVR